MPHNHCYSLFRQTAGQEDKFHICVLSLLAPEPCRCLGTCSQTAAFVSTAPCLANLGSFTDAECWVVVCDAHLPSPVFLEMCLSSGAFAKCDPCSLLRWAAVGHCSPWQNAEVLWGGCLQRNRYYLRCPDGIQNKTEGARLQLAVLHCAFVLVVSASSQSTATSTAGWECSPCCVTAASVGLLDGGGEWAPGLKLCIHPAWLESLPWWLRAVDCLICMCSGPQEDDTEPLPPQNRSPGCTKAGVQILAGSAELSSMQEKPLRLKL